MVGSRYFILGGFMMNFEQFTEEVRAAYPSAGVICTTEQSLNIVVDGQAIDVGGLLAAHFSCWLRLDKVEILVDGMDAAVVSVEFPSMANLDTALVITHGTSMTEETLLLDGSGRGAIEIVSTTSGEILVTVKDKLVRSALMVKEE
jgi:hypothetical protein